MLGTDAGRRSRLLAGAGGPARNVSIAVVSTVVVFAVVVLSIVNSPGWERVKAAFFNGGETRDVFPLVARAFELNVKMFLIAEVLILAFALLLAVVRSLPGPVFFPLRLMVIIYTDFFRGVPTILVVYVLGFGMPGLELTGIPTDPVFWGVVSLVLVYSAYVAEVYRAGIESVHPSQEAAARSLGLSRGQTLRYVIVPQAVRRVIPPLLNDFIGLQKDTALVSVLGSVDALQQANINSAADFNYTPYLVAAFFFVLITIPLARFTDWLTNRERRRRQAGGLA
ncbi:MAG TPA: amino acid ABC transporter permease [Gaiellales bacterium]|jgi:polar amino acid transport system permease protein